MVDGAAANPKTALLAAAFGFAVSLLATTGFPEIRAGFWWFGFIRIAIWTFPLLLAVAAVSQVARHTTQSASILVKYAVASFCGVLTGLLLWWLAMLGWVEPRIFETFGAPLGLSWIIGSLAGLVFSVWYGNRGTWHIASTLLVVGWLAGQVLYPKLPSPEERPRLVVYFERGTDQQQIQAFVREVLYQLSPDTRLGRTYEFRDGIFGIDSVGPVRGRARVLVSLGRTTSEAQRDSIRGRLLESPLVYEVRAARARGP